VRQWARRFWYGVCWGSDDAMGMRSLGQTKNSKRDGNAEGSWKEEKISHLWLNGVNARNEST
jgi:hypothetical protein